MAATNASTKAAQTGTTVYVVMADSTRVSYSQVVGVYSTQAKADAQLSKFPNPDFSRAYVLTQQVQ